MLTLSNTATATLPANAAGSGQILYFNPISPAGLGTGGAFLDLGYFPADTRISPNAEVNREELRAAGRESAATVLLANPVTSASIGYEFGVLTPDADVRALHAGAGAVVGTGAGLTTARAYTINPESAVTGRWVFVKKRPGGSATVIWHPRVQLSANGEAGGDAGSEVLNFVATVQAHTYTPAAAFDGMATAINQYGARFEVPDAATLDALLTALDDEALPE
ncbi:hypothetical protein SAMN04488058_101295 [Deinococcus reticulitermitis]|uniref:Phage major tail protein, phi13 family n=1 Tax=Deinococcus reticulitermitis TaxID=856736 RepID=A0A1H6SGA5_9DEIO|nr:hypothetical protein [Deinococcus reticulitermitis]SEI66963.1 hypothetical protein SAMN04488058_101295 [Deinococcus reticulitermitis]